MPFEPSKREPKIHLDRLLVIADKNKDGEKWIRKNFLIRKTQIDLVSGWLTAFPIFDPVDPVELRIFTGGSLFTINFYSYVDIRSKLAIMHDEVKEKPLIQEVLNHIQIHPGGPRYQHPHPEPEKENEYDRLDLRRRWCAPEPFPYTGKYDQACLSDEPEWLASALRLR